MLGIGNDAQLALLIRLEVAIATLFEDCAFGFDYISFFTHQNLWVSSRSSLCVQRCAQEQVEHVNQPSMSLSISSIIRSIAIASRPALKSARQSG